MSKRNKERKGSDLSVPSHVSRPDGVLMRQATAEEIQQATGMTLAFVPNPAAVHGPTGEARVVGYVVNALEPVPAENIERLRELFGVVDREPSQVELRASESRRHRGLYNLSEAAELLRAAAGQPEGASSDSQFRMLEDAAARRVGSDPLRLRVLHPQTLTPEDFEAWPGPSSLHLVVQRAELSRWLQAVGAGFALPDQQSKEGPEANSGAPADGTPAQYPPGAFPTVETESLDARRARRLDRLEQLGGRMAYHQGDWRVRGGTPGAFKKLCAEEKANSRKPFDPKKVREDLKAAASMKTSKRSLTGG